MGITISQQQLQTMFQEQGFDSEQQAFFAEALQSTDPIIAHKFFDGNVNINKAMDAEEQGDVIGPPMGMGEYLAPLHAMLAGNDYESERRLNESCKDRPSTVDEILAGKLGIYTRRPILNVYQSFGITIDEFNEEYKELVKELGGPSLIHSIATNNFEKAVAQLMARVHMEHARGPSVVIRAEPEKGMGGPSL